MHPINSVLLQLNGVAFAFHPRDVMSVVPVVLLMDGWYDSHPTASFTCEDYKEHETCHVDGKKYVNFGHNANSACCICGGVRVFAVQIPPTRVAAKKS